MNKLKSFLQFLNPILLLLIAYITKMMILVPTNQDAAVISVLGLVYSIYFVCSKYFEMKDKVINENQFRLQVNKDIAQLKEGLNNANFVQKNGGFRK